MDKATLDIARKRFTKGTRVTAICIESDPTVPMGTGGTVVRIDNNGLMWVDWDNNTRIPVVFNRDVIIRNMLPAKCSLIS